MTSQLDREEVEAGGAEGKGPTGSRGDNLRLMKGPRERNCGPRVEGWNVRCQKRGLQGGRGTSLRQSGDEGATERRARLWVGGPPKRRQGSGGREHAVGWSPLVMRVVTGVCRWQYTTVQEERADSVTRHQGCNRPWDPRGLAARGRVSSFKSEVREKLCAQREATG